MKEIIRNSMLALALLTNTAVAQEVPCVDPCGGDGDGDGGAGGGGCSNTDLGSTERYSHTAVFPPGIFMVCYEQGDRIRVTCRDGDNRVISTVDVTYWTGQIRCYGGM